MPKDRVLAAWGDLIADRNAHYLGKADPLEKNLGAKQQEIIRVHSEDMNRHTAYRRQPEKPDAVGSKVISPNVSSGMKQTDEFARRGIKPGDIRAFKPIAVEAGHRKVIEYGGAGVLPGDNMIDLEGGADSADKGSGSTRSDGPLAAISVEPEFGSLMG